MSNCYNALASDNDSQKIIFLLDGVYDGVGKWGVTLKVLIFFKIILKYLKKTFLFLKK